MNDPSNPSRQFRFPARLRLSKHADFQRVFALRMSVSDSRLILYAAQNGLAHCRLGLCVSRKFGPAVQRNRFKRLIREAFRLHQHHLPSGLDFVVLPRLARLQSLAKYQQSLHTLGAKLGRRLSKTNTPSENNG